METIEMLVTVKAYPALSKTYGEVSCIAGIEMTTGGPRWRRLYPVPFRALDGEQQFPKYQRIRLRVSKPNSDRRPETRRPDRDSIELLGEPIPSREGWARRRRFVEPLMQPSMCGVYRQQRKDRTSLGVFRPKRIVDLVIAKKDFDLAKQEIAAAWAAQPSLLAGLAKQERINQLRALEQLPYSFGYHYFCDEPKCKGHTQSIIDWEVAQYYRRVRHSENWRDRMRERWLGNLCAPEIDTAFFVGNQHMHPTSFLILGVWWPERRPDQLALGDLGNI